MSGSTLGGGGEFDRIRAIAARLGDRAAPLGDDCAIVPDEPGTLVASVDQAVEEIHFRRSWLSLEEIGYRAASAALSDLAAAGARCVGLLAAVRAPSRSDPEEPAVLLGGMAEAVTAAGGKVFGGDLGASDRWSIVTTVFGRAPRVLSRRGARPGDRLWITGSLGGARAALAAWQHGREPDRYSRAAFARPPHRQAVGQWLAANGATAMIDLSDGLSGDAGHLAAASGVELIIDLGRLPVLPEVVPEAEAARVTPEEFAAAGGEDYELLVALPPDFSLDQAERSLRETGTRLSQVGEVRAGSGTRFLLDGRPVRLPSYDHFPP